MNARRAWLACIGVWGAGAAIASGIRHPLNGDTVVAQAAPAAPLKQYLVSAMLRKGTQDFAIMLAHGRQPAVSKDEAVGLFVRVAIAQYPGYSVMDTIASEFDLALPSCTKSGTFAAAHQSRQAT